MESSAIVPTSQELAASVPTFGNVLRSIGFSVADSQSNLDQGVLETVKQMSATQIDVITDVILELSDDGEPKPDQPPPLTQKLSLLNFFTPTVHQWQHVALSMDLTVGSFDYQHGMVFNQNIRQTDQVTFPTSWGFLGWFKTDVTADVTRTRSTDISSQFHQDTDWAEGQVRVDALLARRRTTKFPIPAEVSIGPQIFFSQGSITETKDAKSQAVTKRTTTVTVTVYKRTGEANGNIPLDPDAGGLLVSPVTSGKFTGNVTNADGQIQLTVSRDLTDLPTIAPVDGKLTITLGQMTKSTKVRI